MVDIHVYVVLWVRILILSCAVLLFVVVPSDVAFDVNNRQQFCHMSVCLGKGQRTYHCQFFGSEAERGWVNESATLKFEGREAFLRFVDTTINSAGTKAQRKQLCQKYEVQLLQFYNLATNEITSREVYFISLMDLQSFSAENMPIATAHNC
mgnify:FL=1